MERSPAVINIETGAVTPKRAPWNLSLETKQVVRNTLFATPLLLAFLTAILFTFGWSYLYEYYRFFGLDLYSLDLPVYDFLIASLWEVPRAYTILQRTFVFIAFLVLYAMLVSDLFRRFETRVRLAKVIRKVGVPLANLFRRMPIWRESARTVEEKSQMPGFALPVLSFSFFGLFLLLCLCFVVFLGGDVDKRGRDAATALFKHPDVKTVLTFRSEAIPLLNKELVEANNHGALRLLVQTKDNIAVFVKRERDPHGPRATIIPVANLILIQNERLKVNR